MMSGSILQDSEQPRDFWTEVRSMKSSSYSCSKITDDLEGSEEVWSLEVFSWINIPKSVYCKIWRMWNANVDLWAVCRKSLVNIILVCVAVIILFMLRVSIMLHLGKFRKWFRKMQLTNPDGWKKVISKLLNIFQLIYSINNINTNCFQNPFS